MPRRRTSNTKRESTWLGMPMPIAVAVVGGIFLLISGITTLVLTNLLEDDGTPNPTPATIATTDLPSSRSTAESPTSQQPTPTPSPASCVPEPRRTLSPTINVIAFAATRPASKDRIDIFVMNADGSGLRQLTNAVPSEENQEPAWSPDGTRIAFSRTTSAGRDIWIIDADGSNLCQLTRSPGDELSPSWSPSGHTIAYTQQRAGQCDVHTIEIDGSNERNLTEGAGQSAQPEWSPTGLEIIYTHSAARTCTDASDMRTLAIYVMSHEGKASRQLKPDQFGDLDPAYAPDGQRITYTHVTGQPSRLASIKVATSIYTMDADGSDSRALTDPMDRNELPSWSPDGTRIIYTHDNGDATFDIYIMEANGSNSVNLTSRLTTLHSAFHAVWSPVKPNS